MLTALLLAAPLAFAQSDLWAPGSTIPDAASVQVTQRGLDRLSDLAPLAIPSNIPIEDQNVGSSCGEALNMKIGVAVDDLLVIPRAGRLDIQADLQIWMNSPIDEFSFKCGSRCDLYVTAFPASVTMPATIAVVYDADLGRNRVDVTMGELSFTHGLTEDNIQATNLCGWDLLITGLQASGWSLIGFMWQFAEPALSFYLENVVKPDLEEQLEQLLSVAYFADTLEFGGIALDLMVQPSAVVITPDGIDVRAEGATSALRGDCMVARDPGGSFKTATAVPAITDNPSTTEYAVLLSDDIGNQALYALWRSGLFCFDLSEAGDIEIPFPLNTSLLALVGGPGFEALFPENKPIDVMTSPDAVPTVSYQGLSDVTAIVRELGVDFYTEVDFRKARALGVDLEVDVPVDVAFDGATGKLEVQIGLNAEDVAVLPVMNELVAGTDAYIQTSFGGILDVVLDQFLGAQLEDLVFFVPSVESEGTRLGLATISANSAGPENDWLRVRAGIGVVQYDNSDALSTCGSCATGARPSLGWLLVLPLLMGVRRRGGRG